MKSILDFFSSVKLTLVLLLGLSLLATGGTLWPVEQGTIQRFELYYQSLWFRLLLGCLALNLAACSWRTCIRVAGEKKRLLAQLGGSAPASSRVEHILRHDDVDSLSAHLRQQGYRITRSADRALACRGVVGRWSLPILHLSILAVMVGALAAQLGFVGTLNLYVTHQSDEYFDWDIEADRSLGFTFRLDHFEPQYYPIDLRFATYDKQTREQLQEFTAREGETVALLPDLSVQVRKFYPEEQHLVLGILREGALVGEYHSLSGQRSYPNSIDLGVEIKPTAFRDPILKQLRSEVSILENDEVVRQGVIEVNQPLVHRGVAIYQTAYSRDASGFWTCGFQLSKDPGEPLVWLGCIILSLSLILVFMVRFRALGLMPTAAGCRLIPLAGFRDDVGQEKLKTLIALISENVTVTDELSAKRSLKAADDVAVIESTTP
ncbi:MAG: cytochrome c biogenesis protein ResB [Desulfuromonadales bacterium]|nr:cytochrome c biogenesis protein ResB [Desulfuromonadales bacterium]